jgi:cytoskeletal protein CcmA (bactofilin family)
MSSEGTVIGNHVKLTGILSDAQDIIVLGKVEGEVHSDRMVIVGEQAQIRGPITATSVLVSGSVKGNVKAYDRLEISPKGNLAGNIETRNLVIHSGAIFNGRSQVIEGKVPKDEKREEATLKEPLTPSESSSVKQRIFPSIRLAGLANILHRETKDDRHGISADKGQGKISDRETQDKHSYEIE